MHDRNRDHSHVADRWPVALDDLDQRHTAADVDRNPRLGPLDDLDQRDPRAVDCIDPPALDVDAIDPGLAAPTRTRSTSRAPGQARVARARGGRRALVRVVVTEGFDQSDPAAADCIDRPALGGSELSRVLTRTRSTSRPTARPGAARARGGQRALDPVVVREGFQQDDPTAAECIDQPALDVDTLDPSA